MPELEASTTTTSTRRTSSTASGISHHFFSCLRKSSICFKKLICRVQWIQLSSIHLITGARRIFQHLSGGRILRTEPQSLAEFVGGLTVAPSFGQRHPIVEAGLDKIRL